jgi:hypothetical protein
MLLARLVTVKPANMAGNEPRPVVVSTSGLERLFKLLTTVFGRK